MTTRMLLARHGQTTWNAQNRYMGQVDIPLDETGKCQVAALGQRLARETLTAIYASDLQRAWQTASAVAAYHICPLIPEPRLREMDFGSWQSLTYTEIQQKDKINLEAWEADRLKNSPPGGESLLQFSARVEAAFKAIIQNHPDETVLLVAHGGTLKILLCLVLGLPPERYWQIQLSFASLTEIWFYPEGGSLNLLNDTCHLVEEG